MIISFHCLLCSVAEPELEPEPSGAAIFRAAPEPVPDSIFWSVGAESRSRLFKAAPAPSFGKAKKKSKKEKPCYRIRNEFSSIYTDKHV